MSRHASQRIHQPLSAGRAKAQHFCTKPGRFLTPPRVQVPPPGWTPELDRAEEFTDLSYAALMFKSTPLNDA